MHGRRGLQGKLATPIDNVNRRKAILAQIARDKENEESLGLSPSQGLGILFDEIATIESPSEGEESLFEEQPEEMAQKVNEVGNPTVALRRSPIVLADPVRKHEIKPQLQKLIPEYYGLRSEDPLKFIEEFCEVIENFPLSNGVTEDALRMKCFPLALRNSAKKWFKSLTPESLTTWKQVTDAFLLKYFPLEKTKDLKVQIMMFKQFPDEPFHEVWERYNRLLQQCPHHCFPDTMVQKTFYDALDRATQNLLDSTANGEATNGTVDEVRGRFEAAAKSSASKPTGEWNHAKSVDLSPEVKAQLASLQKEVAELKRQKPSTASTSEVASSTQSAMPDRPVTMLQRGSPPQMLEPDQEACAICNQLGHFVDTCPNYGAFTEEGGYEVYAAQGFSQQGFQQQASFPQAQAQSQGARPQQNFGNRSQGQGNFQNRRPQMNYFSYPNSSNPRNTLPQNYPQFNPYFQQQQFPYQQQQPFPQQNQPSQNYYVTHPQSPYPNNNRNSQNFQASAPSNMLALPGPSQEQADADAFMQAQKLKNEANEAMIKRLEAQIGQLSTQVQQGAQPNKLPSQGLQPHQTLAVTALRSEGESKKVATKLDSKIQLHKASTPYVPPTASRMKNNKKDHQPICPLNSFPKRSDPGSFDMNVILDSGEVVLGMMDLGAAVNLMPHSIFEKMSSKVLKATDIRIELADGAISRPLGIVEDVAVIVGGIRVIADFVVLDVGQGARSARGHLLLLGRPFMATTQARIDVGSGTLSMAGEGGSITFSVFGNTPSTSTSLIHKCSYVQIANHFDEERVVQILKVDAKEEVIEEEEFIDEDFFSCVDEEEDIIEQFLGNLEEIEEEEEDCSIEEVQEADLFEPFLSNLDIGEETIDMKSQISVGEMSVGGESILDFRAKVEEKPKVRSRMLNGFFELPTASKVTKSLKGFGTLFAAMGFG